MKFFEYFDPEELDQIHEATLQILENTGIYSTSERFLSTASSLGLTVKDGRILFPRDLVEKGLKSAPSHFSTWGRDGVQEIKWGERRA
ncbi:MAG: trimethylamine methyltransferase family protein, partial [Clostridiales Family XIII bacterium]|nr:trimethylamine methyltransferase family protein [Clostridiales Family XIII bacterium]